MAPTSTSRQAAQATIRDRFLQLVPRMILLNAQVAKDVHLSDTALQTLHMISLRDQPSSPGEIAASLGLPPSTVTRILDQLETRGYIARRASNDDGRRVVVIIDKEATAPVASRFDQYADAMTQTDANFTDAELRTVARYWDDLADRLETTWALAPESD